MTKPYPVRHSLPRSILSIALLPATLLPAADPDQRASPAKVDPGPPGGPPSDAIVLFDGKDLSRWRGRNGDARWKVGDGVLTIAPGTGDIVTRQGFGDCQLHLEWRIPAEVKGEGEGRGNSGLKFHEAYEIQILDSHPSRSNALVQAGAVYKQHGPLVNACRKAGEWQSYDIVFRTPRFDAEKKLTRSGTFTVFLNGVLIQDHAKILGRTNSTKPVPLDERQPLLLQDHGSPVSFRNVWIRELAPEDGV